MSENEKKERETYYNSKPRLGGNAALRKSDSSLTEE